MTITIKVTIKYTRKPIRTHLVWIKLLLNVDATYLQKCIFQNRLHHSPNTYMNAICCIIIFNQFQMMKWLMLVKALNFISCTIGNNK